MHPEFEAVIGLEVHCQLSTQTKIFCGCRARLPDGKSVADVDVNSNTCPVCAGHPGTLPVLNKKVVEFAIRAGLATHCQIQLNTTFARKNYFYPDLPKGYQISQFDRPICENGWLEIQTEGGPKQVQIQRIHMEEDAGKNVHMAGFSLVNLNRAGVPLIEIVSAPDLKTPEEAGAYLRALHAVVTYLGICDGNMQEGNFRCDANVSVMPKGSKQFGTRAEIKNVNSFRFVEKAIEYEVSRQ
ncbi:MAG: Asp-tRNA(Asn)/Glu-tRNA(Gln) amidotransferase subunit GatB, partial [Bdellovibrionia bacterium]